MTSATFAKLELVVTLRPMPIEAPIKLVATAAPVSICNPSVLLSAVPSLDLIFEVIFALLAVRPLAPL